MGFHYFFNRFMSLHLLSLFCHTKGSCHQAGLADFRPGQFTFDPPGNTTTARSESSTISSISEEMSIIATPWAFSL